jgi:hypothetical protein
MFRALSLVSLIGLAAYGAIGNADEIQSEELPTYQCIYGYSNDGKSPAPFVNDGKWYTTEFHASDAKSAVTAISAHEATAERSPRNNYARCKLLQ